MDMVGERSLSVVQLIRLYGAGLGAAACLRCTSSWMNKERKWCCLPRRIDLTVWRRLEDSGIILFGVMDGHAGKEVSSYIQNNLKRAFFTAAGEMGEQVCFFVPL